MLKDKYFPTNFIPKNKKFTSSYDIEPFPEKLNNEKTKESEETMKFASNKLE